MSILHLDGFDSYASAADLSFEYSTTNPYLGTTAGRFGGGACGVGSYQGFIGYPVPSGPFTDLWFGAAINYQTGGSAVFRNIFGITSDVNVEGVIAVNVQTGAVAAYRGDGQTLLGSSASGVCMPGVWNWVEARYKLDGSAGVVEIWVNDVQVLNLTGQNTKQDTTATKIALIGLGNSQYNSTLAGISVNFDDFYLLDPGTSPNTTRLGDSRIETVVPASDASPNNGTPLSGTSHYGAVDEAQWSSSNYLTVANTSGQEELFTVGSISDTPANVWAVRVLAVTEKTDAGSCQLKPLVVSNGTEGDGAAVQLNTSWGHIDAIFEQDPHTTAQWTYANVNAVKVGVKVP